MTKLNFVFSFIIVAILHTYVLSYIYDKNKVELLKPPPAKVSLQLARYIEPKKKVVKKVVEKPVEKIIQKVQKIEPKPIVKKTFKKPIKKKAKRKLIKKIVKKKTKKKVVKKRKLVEKAIKKEKIVKKVKPKKIVKQEIKKVVEKKPIQKISNKNSTRSLAKSKQSKERYKAQLRAAVDRNKKYPLASKRFREQGLVKVSFRVLKNGVFKNIQLISSSGKKRLDRAALKTLVLTASFRSFPKEIKDEYLDFNLPLEFRLN